MPVRMEWRHDTWEENAEPPQPEDARWRRWPLLFLLLALLGSGGSLAYSARQESQLTGDIQRLLDAQRDALLRSDTDAYLALFTPDPAWQAVQLRPERQAQVRQPRRIVELTSDGALISAMVEVRDGTQQLRQRMFFARTGAGVRQSPTVPSYWGARERIAYPWGDLLVYRADAPWAGAIEAAIGAEARRHCRGGCVRLTVELVDDFNATYRPNHVRIPSPQLLGITAAGEPGTRFWQALRAQVAARLSVTTVHFAVPDETTQVAYAGLAEQFNKVNTTIHVEIVVAPGLRNDPAAVLDRVDGALLTPDEALIAGGYLRDLTDFAADPALDSGDFYASIWDGGWWRERLWMVPLGGAVPLIFFDRAAYRAANRPLPPLHWTWKEFEAELAHFTASPPTERTRAALLDAGGPLRVALAYAAAPECHSGCPAPNSEAVARADRWLTERFGAGELYDTRGLDTGRREQLYWNALSSRRQVVFWTDTAGRYEYHFLLDPIGVRPFPATGGFLASAPLYTVGGVVSYRSERSLAVWQWLRFLTYQVAQPNRRLIPARPSVAAESGYWEKLPAPLNEALRAALPFTRPVTAADEARLNE